jgi:pimeloyl-ACP methyl ester carboxylesterase
MRGQRLTGRRTGLLAAPALVVTFILGLATLSGIVPAAAATSAGTRGGAAHTMVVGSQKLTECGSAPTSYCGKLTVPLDYSDPTGPTIQISYTWYPATSPPGGVAKGTVVPVEGGPGFPSEESVEWSPDSVLGAGGYRFMYGSLLDDWNMLAVDLRGTGTSTPLDCPALQNFSGRASGPAFTAVVGACAQKLNHRWKTSTGTYIQAADLFTSVPAAADVAAVIRALDIPKIDLYGDSYGSFFAQVFANHYPKLVRSLILDSTYETQNLDPWYRSTVDDMPADFDNACSRSPACAQATTSPAWNDIEALAQRLRQTPVSGVVPGPDGAMEPVTMDVVGLVDLLNDAAGDPAIYRGLDAAARALLTGQGSAPLLRLYAQRLAFDEDYFDTPASQYSDLLYFAVSCLDYPQLFDMSQDPATRQAELQAAENALPASTFAPFTTAEWLGQNENTEAYSACTAWPSPVVSNPPTVGQPIVPPSMPVLVLGGEFDTWTPPTDAPKVLAELGGNTRFVELANSTHVVGEGDQPCGSQLVQEFVESPQSVQTMNTSCAPAVPPIDSVGVYAGSLAAVAPLTPGPGNDGSAELLKLGAAAVETAGDALSRSLAIVGHSDHGLYGGTSVSKDGGRTITLTGDVLVPGVAVSGNLKVTSTGVSATLTANVSTLGTASFKISWPLAVTDGTAEVAGIMNGRDIVGTTYAP